ncbi:MAG: hypothetical protein K0R66_128 [Gammaproteobacteria bacterium]|jgi:glycosyltransferase involved in cell wall biosynthesis|nr:hypothetical protein [Gammaproteobacteria bacterium]
MSSKTKLVHIITSLSSGGAQVLLYNLLKNADHERFDIEVICLGKAGPIAENIEALPCKIHYLKTPKFFPLISFYQLVRILKLSRPDVVHTWMYHADLLGGLAAKMAGIKKIVWSIHHSDASNLKLSTRWVMKLCAKLSYYVPSAIIVTAKKAAEYHEHYGYQASKMSVIRNAIDPAAFLPNQAIRLDLRQKLGIADNELVFGVFARFHPQKGFKVLLEAFSQLNFPSKLVLAGAGIDLNNGALLKLIEQFDLSEKVILFGEVQNVAECLPFIDILVCSSISGETSPLILMEAMSCELPCIVTEVGDCAEIIGECGWSVKPNNVPQMLSVMNQVAALPVEQRQKLGRQARSRVVEHYHIKAMTEAYEKLYLSKKVLIIGSSVSSLLRFRLHLMKDWQARGYQVIAAAPGNLSSWGSFDKLRMSKEGEPGIQFQAIHLNHTSLNPFSDVRTILSLRKLIKSHRPDYVLTYTLKPIVYGSWLAKRYKVPHIASMLTGLGYVFSGNSFKQRCLQAVLKSLLKRVVDYNQVVFFQNPDDANQFIDNKLVPADKVKVVNGSGVDLSEYKMTAYPEKCSFILVARLLKEKGIADYVAAAKIIRSQYPEVRFLLVGSHYPSPSSISQSELDEWLQSKNIEYLGELSDVRPAIEQASVFVLPSYYREGTPRAILEAMAMGRAIITTDMPGCRETVQEGANGYLIPPQNPEALANAMRQFIEQPDLIISQGQASRKMAEEKYDVRKVNQAIIKAFEME